MPQTKTLIVVAGPTAVGKTELCVRLAGLLGTEVISADSRQCYREMNIGTAKPTLAERHGIAHHFIDSHSVTEPYNAAAFERDALALLQNSIFPKHQTCLVAGGSTLYVKTLADGMDAMPGTDPAIRQQLAQAAASQGLAPLLAQLDELDPAYGQTVDRANPQRIIRALEVCLSAGRPYSSFRQGSPAARPFTVVRIGLNRDRDELYGRIDARVAQMLAHGLVDEVRGLLAHRHLNALQTVGYREVFGYLDGAYGHDEMARLIGQNTRRYAKRQRTFFGRDTRYRWFHPERLAEISDYIAQQTR